MQPVDSGFPNGSADMQFTSVTGVTAVPKVDAMVNVAHATMPLERAFWFGPVVVRRTSPLDTALDVRPLPAPVSCAPALAETNVSFVGSKLTSIWNEAGAVLPARERAIGIVTAWPATPLPPQVDNVTVDVMFAPGTFTT